MSRYRVLFDIADKGLWALVVSAETEERATELAEFRLRAAGEQEWRVISTLLVPDSDE